MPDTGHTITFTARRPDERTNRQGRAVRGTPSKHCSPLGLTHPGVTHAARCEQGERQTVRSAALVRSLVPMHPAHLKWKTVKGLLSLNYNINFLNGSYFLRFKIP